jgi:hypothetical protein
MKNSLILIIILTALGLSSCRRMPMKYSPAQKGVVGKNPSKTFSANALNNGQYWLRGELILENVEHIQYEWAENGVIKLRDTTHIHRIRIEDGTKGQLIEKVTDPITGETTFKISFSSDSVSRFLRFLPFKDNDWLYKPTAIEWRDTPAGKVGKIKYGSQTWYMTGFDEAYVEFRPNEKSATEIETETEKGRDVKGKSKVIRKKNGKVEEIGTETEIEQNNSTNDGNLEDLFEKSPVDK